MMHEDILKRHKELLRCLSCLPRRILSIYSFENIPEFVLHELCSQSCFDLTRAAYFVDNPDFEFTRGIAGLDRSQACGHACSDVWREPAAFSSVMNNSTFNQQVRSTHHAASAKNNSEENVVAVLADRLGMKNCDYRAWDLKHDNRGILLYEREHLNGELFGDHFEDSLHVLSFCPIG